MRVKIESGCDAILAGWGIRILQHKWDLLILTGRMRDSCKIDGGLRDGKQKNNTLWTLRGELQF